MEQTTTETKEVLLQSDEALQTLIKVTGEKLRDLEKFNPNDVQTRVKYKEVERQAIGMQKQIKELLNTL